MKQANRRGPASNRWAKWLLTLCLAPLLTLSAGQAAAAAPPDLPDGTYTVEVTLAGGSGRATVASPAELTVQNGSASARIEWSSDSYDYMKVGGELYRPLAQDGNAVFIIPVEAFDTPIDVIGDTTAMSTPHEVAYTLTFVSASISQDAPISAATWAGIAVVVLAGIALLFLQFHPKRSRTT